MNALEDLLEVLKGFFPSYISIFPRLYENHYLIDQLTMAYNNYATFISYAFHSAAYGAK